MMKGLKDSEKSLIIITMLFATVLMTYGFPIPSVEAASDFYTEDFTTTTYLDDANTNATGWGDGSLTLANKEPILMNTFDTGAQAYDVCIDGQLAYVSTYGNGVRIVNISDPSQPEEIGNYSIHNKALNVDVEGDIAYVAGYEDGLLVLNVSDPTSPSLLGSYNPGGQAMEVVVEGNLAYMGWSIHPYQGFRIINVTDPKSPKLISFYDEYNSIPWNLEIDGNVAYLSCEAQGLRILNITDPREPEILRISVPGVIHARGIAVESDYFYITGSSNGLKVVNISNPSQAYTISSSSSLGTGGVCIDGNYAYVGMAENYQLSIVDITDPTNPVHIWYQDTPGYVYDLKVDGEYLYVATSAADLHIYKIADVITPEFTGEYLAGAYQVAVEGDVAFVTDHDYGLRIVNVTQTDRPTSIANYSGLTEPWKISVEGNYAYILDTVLGLEVINITDLTNPTRAGGMSSPLVYCLDFDVEGNFAYIADNDGMLHVVNITDPAEPEWLSECDTGNMFTSVKVDGNFAYLADSGTSFIVINVTTPENPTLIGSSQRCDSSSVSLGLWIDGNYAFLADHMEGLIVFNITDPSHPQNITTLSLPDYALDIWVDGNLAYVATNMAGILVLNISEPQSPEIAYTHSTPNNAFGIYLDGDHAFVACNTSVQIIEVKRSLCRQHESMSIGQSENVLTTDGTFSQIHATLTVSQDVPADTATMFYLSADNGTHWEAVTPGVVHAFTDLGNDIKWRVELTTSENLETPTVFSLDITTSTTLQASTLLTPSDGVYTNDATPTFEWTAIAGAINYLLQMDTSNLFDSIDLLNITVADSTTYTPPSDLADNTWYWRVAANDSDEVIGAFSETWSMVIDTVPPGNPGLLVPENETLQNNNTRLFAWTHVTGWDYYTIQFDTSHTFDSTDLRTITDITDAAYTPSIPLTDGTWYWRVRAVDLANNIGDFSDAWSVTIDGTPPSWDTAVSDQTCECGEEFRYPLDVSDTIGIQGYQLNDTLRFGIMTNGTVYNNGLVPVGEYGLEVTVTDLALHISTASFTVTVEDTTEPTWYDPPESIALFYSQMMEYDVHAMDPSGIEQYTLSDTTNFTIDAAGILTNLVTLDPGIYALTVYAHDPYGNIAETIITITVDSPTGGIPDSMLVIISISTIAGVIVVVVVIFLKKKS
ncbi:MAG: hypothetical protein ACTSV2_04190 [Candidatus Thorarchaeota archaeon]